MHFSDNPNNFRNKQYLSNMEDEFRRMFNAYHKYIAYRNKLRNELTMNEEQKEIMNKIDKKFVKNIKISNKRIEKEDFQNVL